MEKFAQIAAQCLSPALESYGLPAIQASDLETPPDRAMGDFAYPCFKLSKQLRKAPPAIAQEIVQKIEGDTHAYTPALRKEISVKAVGPYVNFTVEPKAAFETLLGEILTGPENGTFAKKPSKSGPRWVLEYSSPNIAKPFNVYHLRPTALGAALARVGLWRGFDVIRINHLGDWGTQYGKLSVAFKLFKDELPADPTIEDLVRIYVKFHQALEKDPSLEERAREAFLKLEKKDPEMTALWKSCVDISLKDFKKTYERLDVEFDHYWGESFYQDQLAPILADLKKRGLLVESEGAYVVQVTDEQGRELPPCILEKKDGASIYATRDLAAALYRHKQFDFDRMSYIVGQEQRLHFQQVFGVLRRMGEEWVSKCEHIPFGLYRFKDSKMSTRKGNFVTLNECIEEAKNRARELMKTRIAEGSAAEGLDLEATAEAVGIGALVFFDLSVDPARDVEFDLDRVVSFEGETGPYLQYAHTRCLSMLRKAQETGELKGTPHYDASLIAQLQKPEEIALVKFLGQLPQQLDRTLSMAKASQLAIYLIDVTKLFNAFYRECHVLGQARELTQARLMLVEATRRVLGLGLKLLGVPAPERM